MDTTLWLQPATMAPTRGNERRSSLVGMKLPNDIAGLGPSRAAGIASLIASAHAKPCNCSLKRPLRYSKALAKNERVRQVQ